MNLFGHRIDREDVEWHTSWSRESVCLGENKKAAVGPVGHHDVKGEIIIGAAKSCTPYSKQVAPTCANRRIGRRSYQPSRRIVYQPAQVGVG